MAGRALAHLQAMRLAGHKPAESVRIWLDAWPWFADGDTDVQVAKRESVARLDLRPLVGCNATLFVEAMTARTSALVERLKALCPELVVVVLAWLDRGEVGFRITTGGEPEDLPRTY